jgi:hypothetical protein
MVGFYGVWRAWNVPLGGLLFGPLKAFGVVCGGKHTRNGAVGVFFIPRCPKARHLGHPAISFGWLLGGGGGEERVLRGDGGREWLGGGFLREFWGEGLGAGEGRTLPGGDCLRRRRG